MAVPYLPHVPLRACLPWRAPIAWGTSNGITNADPAQARSAASIVPPAPLPVSFAAGAAQVVPAVSRRWVADGLSILVSLDV
jgi:hypothetical protein